MGSRLGMHGFVSKKNSGLNPQNDGALFGFPRNQPKGGSLTQPRPYGKLSMLLVCIVAAYRDWTPAMYPWQSGKVLLGTAWHGLLFASTVFGEV